MRTIKTIPTLMLAASLGAGMILVSEAAFARNNGHQEHGDHQEHNGKRSGNADRSSASQSRHFSEPKKKDRGKVKVTGTGTSGTVIRGGTPPRGPVATTNPSTTGVPIIHGGNPPRGPVATTNPPTTGAPLREAQWPPRTHQRLPRAAILRQAQWPAHRVPPRSYPMVRSSSTYQILRPG